MAVLCLQFDLLMMEEVGWLWPSFSVCGNPVTALFILYLPGSTLAICLLTFTQTTEAAGPMKSKLTRKMITTCFCWWPSLPLWGLIEWTWTESDLIWKMLICGAQEHANEMGPRSRTHPHIAHIISYPPPMLLTMMGVPRTVHWSIGGCL